MKEICFNETFLRVRKIVNMLIGGQESLLTPESSIRGTGKHDCGLNEELYVLALTEHLKEEFSEEIPIEELLNIQTLGDIVNYYNTLAGIE